MRTKSLAMLALSSLVMACIAPAMADDTGTGMPMEQMLADNSSTGSVAQTQENIGQDLQASNNTQAAQGDVSNSGNAIAQTSDGSSSNNNSGSSDQGTPDTATGDDDY